MRAGTIVDVMERFDIVVIGGGIAGVTAAHYLSSAGRSVVLLERESQLAYHTTGRSAALYFENYGHLSVRALSKASRRVFEDPPPGLSEQSLLSPRGSLMIARPHQMDHFDQIVSEGLATGVPIERLSAAQAGELVPSLRTELIEAAVWEPDAADMDVAAIHQMYVKGLRRSGGGIRVNAGVIGIGGGGGDWRVSTATGNDIGCSVIVNAAGAWCDEMAGLAGIPPIGLQPRRRTAFMVPGEPGWRNWPLVADIDHDFYFKPDGSQLLCSPADETPVGPCDARPDELDIAIAIERINEATTLGIRTVRSSWAGLRSFLSDEGMGIGFDPSHEGFFWLAGQGGTGIQTAPAAGMLAAGLILEGVVPEELARHGVDATAFAIERFR